MVYYFDWLWAVVHQDWLVKIKMRTTLEAMLSLRPGRMHIFWRPGAQGSFTQGHSSQKNVGFHQWGYPKIDGL